MTTASFMILSYHHRSAMTLEMHPWWVRRANQNRMELTATTATPTKASAPSSPSSASQAVASSEAALWGEGRRRTGELRRWRPVGLPAGDLALVPQVPGLDVPHQVRGQLLADRRTLRGSLRDGTGFCLR